MPLLPQSTADLVREDGTPRVCDADDGTQHMLYRDGGMVRSCLLGDWPAAQQDLAAKQQAAIDAAALRQTIRDRLTGMAGKRVDDVTVGELKTLLLYLVWREGGIAKDLTVKPIGEWGK